MLQLLQTPSFPFYLSEAIVDSKSTNFNKILRGVIRVALQLVTDESIAYLVPSPVKEIALKIGTGVQA